MADNRRVVASDKFERAPALPPYFSLNEPLNKRRLQNDFADIVGSSHCIPVFDKDFTGPNVAVRVVYGEAEGLVKVGVVALLLYSCFKLIPEEQELDKGVT